MCIIRMYMYMYCIPDYEKERPYRSLFVYFLLTIHVNEVKIYTLYPCKKLEVKQEKSLISKGAYLSSSLELSALLVT